MEKEVLTSIKINEDLFEEFKITLIKNKLAHKKFSERCMFLYITDQEFRDRINNLLNYSLDKH